MKQSSKFYISFSLLLSSLMILASCGNSASESTDTLEPVSNTGYEANALGYYGEGVQFGNDPIVGYWDVYPPSGNVSDFENNGDVYIVDDFGTTAPYTYGVSENGLNLYLSAYGEVSVNIVSKNGPCYDVERGENAFTYCRYPKNENGFYGPLLYLGRNPLVGTWRIERLQEEDSELPEMIYFGEDGNATIADSTFNYAQKFPYGASNTTCSFITLFVDNEKVLSNVGQLEEWDYVLLDFNGKRYKFYKISANDITHENVLSSSGASESSTGSSSNSSVTFSSNADSSSSINDDTCYIMNVCTMEECLNLGRYWVDGQCSYEPASISSSRTD